MSDDKKPLTWRIDDQFGTSGLYIFFLAVVVLLITWAALSVRFVWPAFLPVVAAAYMVFRVQGGDDE